MKRLVIALSFVAILFSQQVALADSSTSRIVMISEVSGWCQGHADINNSNGWNCSIENVRWSELPDGYTRIVVAYSDAYGNHSCAPMTLPDNLEGEVMAEAGTTSGTRMSVDDFRKADTEAMSSSGGSLPKVCELIVRHKS